MTNTNTYSKHNQTEQPLSSARIWKNHHQEWLDSCVDPSIIALNVKSLDGTMGEDDPIEKLCYAVERNKTPAFNGWPAKIIQRYKHTTEGGWWVNGVDPVTGIARRWGQFKSDNPFTYKEHADGFETEAKIKTIKYEAPKGVPTEAMFLAVTWKISRRVAKRTNNKEIYKQWKKRAREAFKTSECTNYKEFLREYCDRYFWKWVLDNPAIGIAITEGAKKAGALLTQGIAGLSIPGIFNGCPTKKDKFGNKLGLPQLLPDLKLFATEEREVSICFDNDQKLKTKLAVKQATERLGKLFSVEGCKVSVMQWVNCPEKGIDDLIGSKGQDYFESVLKSRLSLADYKLKGLLALYPDLTINERYIPSGLTYPANTKFIRLRSPHGTGKTEWLAKEIQSVLDNGQKVIIIVHRQQLARELAKRFNIDYRTQLNKKVVGSGQFGYSLCIDSLHDKAKPSFDPDAKQWEDAVVIIDEVEQVLWHLLNGGTCEKNRVRILKTFKRLLQRIVQSEEGKIFIADADLCSISINYIEQLIGYKVPSFTIDNSYVLDATRLLYRFLKQDPGELISTLEDNIKLGHKVIIHTDGQKYKSTWGTRSLESHLRKKFPSLKILRIDSKSVKDKSHPAFGCIDKLNQVLPNFDIVICSPVIETGVSIDVNHFNSVYVLSNGVQTVDSVCQTMQRVRTDIPRYVWARSYSPTRIGNGSNDIKSLLSSTHKLASAHINLLMRLGISESEDISFYEENEEVKISAPSLTAWAKRAVIINNQNYKFADNLFSKAEKIGYKIVVEDDKETDFTEIRNEVKETAKLNYSHHRKRVKESPDIDDKTYQEWKGRDDLTETEEETLKKAEISRIYATDEVDETLIEKHDNGWFKQIQLDYYLNYGKQYIVDKERKLLSKLIEQSDNGEVFKPDLCRNTLATKIFCLEQLEIQQFLDPEKEFTHQSLMKWFEKINNPLTRFQVKTILGVSIGKERSAIAVAQRLLKVLGLTLVLKERRRVNRGEEATRIYKCCDLNHDDRLAVFDRWLERDEIKDSENNNCAS